MKTLFPGQKIEPATCSGDPGTISFFGHETQDPSSKVVVTCDHVIKASTDKDKVSSPSSGCCPSCCPTNVVGVALKGAQGPQGNFFVDAASAKLNPAEAIGSNQIPGLAAKDPQGKFLGGAITGTAQAKPAERVVIFGAKSGRMEGMVVLPEKNGQPVFTDRLVIEVDAQYATDVQSGSGDSGAPIINRFNKLIGIMFSRGVTDPDSITEQTRLIFASHIAPVLSALNVTFDPAPAPAAGELVAPPQALAADQAEPAEERWLDQIRGLVHDDPVARGIVEAGARHAREIVHLVNHRRPVTVAWHRGKGPAWSAHLIKSWREPDHVIPDAIDGITRMQLLARMREVLAQQGSPALAADLDRNADAVFALAGIARLRDAVAHAGGDADAVSRLGLDTLAL